MDITAADFDALKGWTNKKWVVLTPTGKSEAGDILFEATPYDLVLQVLGGLEKKRILLVTDNEGKASKLANVLLAIQTGEFDIEDLFKAVRES